MIVISSSPIAFATPWGATICDEAMASERAKEVLQIFDTRIEDLKIALANENCSIDSLKTQVAA